MSLSIGARLTLWYTAAFAVAALVLGAAIWLAVQQSLYQAVDSGLRDRVQGIHRFIEDHKSRLLLDEVKEEFREYGDFFQVVDEDGRTVHRGAALDGAQLTALVTDSAGFSTALGGGEPLRIFSQRVAIDGHAYTIQVAAPLQDLQGGLRAAVWLLVPALPLSLLFAAVGGHWLSRRALAPVDRITQTARLIGADSLSHRIEFAPTGDELERLARTFNEMIARLENAFQKITRFTADASHELRTPLAVMRTTAEVALRAPQAGDEQRAALEYIVAEIERTSHLVENLLLIAKADAGAADLKNRRVDVVEAIREACSEASVLARVKGLRFDAQLPETSLWVNGDRDALRRLFLILLDNAVKYTPAGGSMAVAVGAENGHVVGTVRDTGIGIAPEHLPHVFDRFYRADRARSRTDGGAGLGLAIGRWIAEIHGGRLRVDSEPQRGSSFHVDLPSV
jgi:heavy metal sensor kinase